MGQIRKNLLSILATLMLCMIATITVCAASQSTEAFGYGTLTGTSTQSNGIKATTSVSKNVDQAYLYTFAQIYLEEGYYYTDPAVTDTGATTQSCQFFIAVTFDMVLDYAVVYHSVQGGSTFNSYYVVTQVDFQ